MDAHLLYHDQELGVLDAIEVTSELEPSLCQI